MADASPVLFVAPVESVERCGDCGLRILQPAHDRCECGGRVKIYRHYCRVKNRTGYCQADCGQLRWVESRQQWVQQLRGHTICRECGVRFPSREKGHYWHGNYCDMCQPGKSMPVSFFQCKECSEWFCARGHRPESSRRKFCTSVCRKRSLARAYRLRRDAERDGVEKGPKQRRRRTRDEIVNQAVRQGYRCELCRGLLDLGAHYNSAKFPTDEHIVPRSKGGSDDDRNFVVTHRRCNILRGNSGSIQLSFGKEGHSV